MANYLLNCFTLTLPSSSEHASDSLFMGEIRLEQMAKWWDGTARMIIRGFNNRSWDSQYLCFITVSFLSNGNYWYAGTAKKHRQLLIVYT